MFCVSLTKHCAFIVSDMYSQNVIKYVTFKLYYILFYYTFTFVPFNEREWGGGMNPQIE